MTDVQSLVLDSSPYVILGHCSGVRLWRLHSRLRSPHTDSWTTNQMPMVAQCGHFRRIRRPVPHLSDAIPLAGVLSIFDSRKSKWCHLLYGSMKPFLSQIATQDQCQALVWVGFWP